MRGEGYENAVVICIDRSIDGRKNWRRLRNSTSVCTGTVNEWQWAPRLRRNVERIHSSSRYAHYLNKQVVHAVRQRQLETRVRASRMRTATMLSKICNRSTSIQRRLHHLCAIYCTRLQHIHVTTFSNNDGGRAGANVLQSSVTQIVYTAPLYLCERWPLLPLTHSWRLSY